MGNERKDNVTYRFPKIHLSSLQQLYERSPLHNHLKFKEEYGRITGFVKGQMTKHQEKGVHTLLQFYDPPLRCFTFPDYQIAPTLEEYSNLLDISIKSQIPFYPTKEVPSSEEIAKALRLSKTDVENNLKVKGGHHGFQLDFLLKKGHSAADKEDWGTFNMFLACSIYGVVLFPNVPNFVDVNAIQIFSQKNPVSTLLGDFYHAIHTRNQNKRRIIMVLCPITLHLV